jgi:hypothetical protein
MPRSTSPADPTHPLPAGLRRRQWLAIGAAGVLGAAWARSAWSQNLPAPRDGQWHDATRRRTLPWRLRLPAGRGPWPLVLYSHGLGGSRDGGAAWGEAWADAGIAVLHLHHPGSDTEVLRDGGVRGLRAAASGENLVARVADVRFAVDEIGRAARGDGAFAGLRLDAFGVAGHSFGAITTQAVAGQRFPGGQVLADPRPRAFVALSPSPPREGPGGGFGGASVQQAFGAITRPFLCATGSLDGDPLAGTDDGAARATVYDGLPPGQRGLLWLDGADHQTLGGGRPGGARMAARRRDRVSVQREAEHHALVARITTAWWRAQLLDSAEARATLAGPHPLGPRDRFVLG